MAPTSSMYSPGAGLPVAGPATNSTIRQGQETGNTAFDPNTRDVYDMAAQERNLAQNQGNEFLKQFGAQTQEASQRQQGYNDLTKKLYDPIWNGGGGYTQDEQDRMRGPQSGPNSFHDLTWTQDQADSNYLTPDEQAQIKGSPYQPFDYATGQAGKLEAYANEGAGHQRDAVGGMRDAYGNAIDPSKLSMSDGYTRDLNGAVDNGSRDMTGAIDSAAGEYGSITRDPSLGIDPNYAKTASMSDQEVRDAGESASAKIGAGYQGAIDDMQSRAAQSGTATPLGIAAMRGQLQHQSGAEAGDAAVRAELDARARQREAAQNVENTRLGASQYRSGLQMDATGRVMNARGDAAKTTMGARMDAANDIEGTRLGANRDISTRQMTAAGDVGHSNIANEQDITHTGQQVGQYGANLTTSQLAQGETNASNRANTVATNRQGANTYNQGQQWNRGMTINDTMAGREKTIADAHQAVQAEGRTAAQTGARQASTDLNNSGNQQLQAWQTQMGGRQGATSQYAGWGNSQNQYGFGSNFARSAGAAAGQMVGSGFSGYKAPSSGGNNSGGGVAAGGGIITKPAVLIGADGQFSSIGEEGPEAIIPLNPSRQGDAAPYKRLIMGHGPSRRLSPGGVGGGGGPMIQHVRSFSGSRTTPAYV